MRARTIRLPGKERSMVITSFVTAVMCLGCHRQGPMEPTMVAQAPQTAVTSVPGCATVDFRLIGDSAVALDFPDPGSCGNSLLLVPKGNQTYNREGKQVVRTGIRVINHSSQPVTLPIHLLLAADSVTVLDPPGTSNTTIRVRGVDSIVVEGEPWAGAEVLRIGGDTGVLVPGDSTEGRRLRFKVNSPAVAGRLSFVATANEVVQDTSKPTVPNNSSFERDPSIVIAPPGDSVNVFYRKIFKIKFHDGVAGSTIRDVFGRFNAEVVGGAERLGVYYVKVPDPGPTWAAFDSLHTRLNAEPSVEFAAHFSARSGFQFDGRWPNDGAGAARTDWFQNTNSPAIWPRLAVRAPLAWGCSNGLYSISRPTIGVIDYKFDATHSDFASSAFQFFQPNPTDPLVPAPSGWSAGHGTEVLGIVAAEGDNQGDIAGMVWASNVVAYQLDVQGNVPDDLGDFLSKALMNAGDNGVRVFLLSGSLGPPDSTDVAFIRLAIEDYLSRGGLIVTSAGNFDIDFTVAGIDTTTSPDLGFKKAVVSFFDPGDVTGYKNQILVVAASNINQQRHFPSTFIQGATEIAAPGEDVMTLMAGGGTISRNGTSIAAPFVAGVALQLWTMDPTLTAHEVKDYILDGAREPRWNPNSGALDANLAVTVSGFPEPAIYQLDAYGSLSKLSRERPGTPICGLEVVRTGTTLTLMRDTPEAITIPALSVISSMSIAQGGRLISASGGNQTVTLDHQGNQLELLPGPLDRQYLERDTVFRLSPTLLVRRGLSGPPDSFDISIVAEGALFSAVVDAEVSPSGEFVAVTGDYVIDSTGFRHQRFRIMTFASQQTVFSQTNVVAPSTDECFGSRTGEVEWTHDSEQAFFLRYESDDCAGTSQTILTPGSVAGSSPSPAVFSGVDLLDFAFSGDDAVYFASQVSAFVCELVRGVTGNPGTLVTVSTIGAANDCGGNTGRTIPNIMAAASGHAVPGR